MAFLNIEHDLSFFNLLKFILLVDFILLLADNFGAPEAVVHACKHHLKTLIRSNLSRAKATYESCKSDFPKLPLQFIFSHSELV